MLQESVPLPRQMPLNLLANGMENVEALLPERSMLLKQSGGGVSNAWKNTMYQTLGILPGKQSQ